MTYCPDLSTTAQVVRQSTCKDEAGDNRRQHIHSLHAEGFGEDKQERIACWVVNCSFDVDNDEKVADEEDDRDHTAEQV